MRKFILLAAALNLAGCQTLQSFVAPTSPAAVTTDINALKSDAQLIVSGLQGILPALTALGPQYATTIASIEGDLGKASSYLPTLAGFSNVADATTTTQQITTALSDALKLAASLPIPQPYAGAITAANVLLPLILTEAGLPQPAAAPMEVMPAGILQITPAEARGRLKLAAQQHV